MTDDYITSNELLNNKLSLLGFKRKNKYSFVRKYNNAIQSLCWGHRADCREPNVRYYSVTAYIEFPIVNKTAKEMGVIIDTIGQGLGYFMPVSGYKEWRLAGNATDDEIAVIVDEIAEITELYAVPFMNKYSRVRSAIAGIENNEFVICKDFKHLLPVLYLVDGQRDKACAYIDTTLDRMEKKYIAETSENEKLMELYGIDNIDTITGRVLESYKTYADKFKRYIGENKKS